MEGDLIDLRSPAPQLSAHPIRVSELSEDGAAVHAATEHPASTAEESVGSDEVPPAPPLLQQPPAAKRQGTICSLLDDIYLSDEQQAAGYGARVDSVDAPSAPSHQPGDEADLIPVTPTAPQQLQQEEQRARREASGSGDHDAAVPSGVPFAGFGNGTTGLSPWRPTAAFQEGASSSETPPRIGAAPAPAPAPEPEQQHVVVPQQASKEVEELKLRLAKAEACREALAREVGQHKAIISKMEGSKTSYEKQLKQAEEEKAELRAALLAARQEAAEAKIAAGVTPERCRASARALSEEAQRAEQAKQQKEAELIQAKALLEYEVEEMKSLKDFMSQERLSLLAVSEGQAKQLDEAQQALHEARARLQALEAELQGSQDELREAKRQVWALNNASIELQAELAAVRSQAGAAQAALADAQQAVNHEAELRHRAEAEVKEIRVAGVALYKQIRAVSHALEGNMQVFQPIPRVALSIRSLQEWCAKKAAYWSAQATVASEAEASSAIASAAEQGHSVAVITASSVPSNGTQTSASQGAAACATTVPDAGDNTTLNLFAFRPGASSAATSSAAPVSAAVPGSVLKRPGGAL